MIDSIDFTKYEEHISTFNEQLSQAQWSDQFELRIQMEAPTTKPIIPTELVQSFKIKEVGFDTDDIAIGNQRQYSFEMPDDSSLDVVLYNIRNFSLSAEPSFMEYMVYKRATVAKRFQIVDFSKTLGYNLQDYFLLDKDGKKILPQDGTYLLPDEYSFIISGYALDNYWTKRRLFSGRFILDGGIDLEFSSDGGKMQELALSFKKIEDLEMPQDEKLER